MKTKTQFQSALLIIFGLLFTVYSCKKEFDFPQGQKPNISGVTLNYATHTGGGKSLNNDGQSGSIIVNEDFNKEEIPYSKTPLMPKIPTKQAMGEIINSNGTVTGDANFFFSFWLSPYLGTNIAKGIFLIKDSNNQTIYQSAAPENGIDIKFINPGTYTLSVSGTFNGNSFNFVNITIIVTTSTPPPPPTNTAPVNLKNFQVQGLTTASVDVAISKNQYPTQTSATWFWVRRINGMNFIGNQSPSSSTTDSVYFTLIFDQIDQNYIEFNAGFHDGSPGGVWLNPSTGNPPSILYNGTNIPYSSSHSYFGFRFHILGGGAYALKTHSGTTLLQIGQAYPIPGNNGDGPTNNYQVRWSGYEHYFKTALQSPVLRYKVNTATTWSYVNMSALTTNPNYQKYAFPNGTTGSLYFQWGTGNTDATFAAASNEFSNSQYYYPPLQCCVKVL